MKEMKAVSTNKVIENLSYLVYYKCPHCSFSSYKDVPKAIGEKVVKCNICWRTFILKWDKED